MKELTGRQAAIVAFIDEYRERHGLAPSFREIQEHFGFASPNAVTKHVRLIEEKGYLKSDYREGEGRGRSRSLQLLGHSRREVPLVGRIAAGVPIEAIENVERGIDLSSLGIDNVSGDFFALRVKGDSMIEAHILDGDIVVIRKQPYVSVKEPAAVLLNGEATLKYVRPSKEAGGVTLMPANAAMKPIEIAGEKLAEFQILGKVVNVIRSFSR